MPIHDNVCHFAQTTPRTIAISIGDEQHTYKELWQKTVQHYSLFQNILPDKPSVTIALILSNSTQFAEYYLAATLSPYVCAVIDPATPEKTLHTMLEQLQPDYVIVDEHLNSVKVVSDLGLKYGISGQPVHDCTLSENTDALPSLDAVGKFLIGFTSGTTSQPKAYSRSKPAWRTSFESGYDIFHLHDCQRTLCPCPLSHGIGLYCMNEVLHSGGSFYGLPHWDAPSCAALIERASIDRIVMVPSMLVALRKNNAMAYDTVRYIVSAGAKLDLYKYHIIREIFPHAHIQEYYGASELGFISVSHLHDDIVESIIDSVGIAFENVSIAILDDEGNELQSGETGTICVRSPQISDGYLWNSEATGITYYDYHTVGDIGYVTNEGYLYVLGRKGGMVISGGYNVYLSEVETIIKSYENVTEAVILSIPDEYLGQKIVAIIEAHNTEFLMSMCKKSLATYKIPREFYQISEWPLTSSGKIQKTALQTMLTEEASSLVKLSSSL